MTKLLYLILFGLLCNQAISQWKQCGLEGKAIQCVVVNPTDKNIIFVGTQDEGIYSSPDAGSTWFLADSQSSINSIVIDRTNPKTIYAGKENGILVSRDNGNTFFTLATFDGLTVNCIALDETPTKAIILGTTKGIYKSLDGGKRFLSAGLEDHNIYSLTINNKGSKAIIYAATEGAGIFKSANYGISWASKSRGLSDDMFVYSIVCDFLEPSKLYASTLEFGFFKSIDNAESWDNISIEISSRQGYAIAQSIDSKKNRTVIFIANFSGDVLKSSDNGSTWNRISEPLKEIAGLCMGVTNVVPSTLYLGTTKGLYKLEEK